MPAASERRVWDDGATIQVAYVVGDRTDSEKRATFVQSSVVRQSFVAWMCDDDSRLPSR